MFVVEYLCGIRQTWCEVDEAENMSAAMESAITLYGRTQLQCRVVDEQHRVVAMVPDAQTRLPGALSKCPEQKGP